MKHLFWKAKDNTIRQTTPINSTKLQKYLIEFGYDRYIENMQQALDYESARNEPQGINNAQNLLNWAKSVKDFNNITDEEWQLHHECHIEIDYQYKHWIDDSVVKNIDYAYRNAWSDIDAQGNITHDLDKAKQIKITRDLEAQQHVAMLDAQKMAQINHPLNSQIITSLEQLQEK